VSEKTFYMTDGNEAAAMVAHQCNEVMAIYPITPSSNMGEWADQWAAEGRKNIFGTVPQVVEMQSEAGAAGAVHGSLQAGALTCTFTASQGLLLMIPNMFKIAGELTPTVFHVSARAVAAHALSIFGEHSDVLSCRTTGWAYLCAVGVQDTHDMAMIAYAATYKARVPFLHFFDGFRTSHEVNKIEPLSDDLVRQMLDAGAIEAFRARALSPEHPVLRGTAQNPDVFFQAREACNPFHEKVAGIVQAEMDKFAQLTGRRYNLFDYYGSPTAENIIVIMGSGAGVVEEYLDFVNDAKAGMVTVRLYRPFDVPAFLAALPKTVKRIAVLDRTKEPGTLGEPLFQDVLTVLAEHWTGAMPTVIGGRYGLASKEFTPAMVKTIYDELEKSAPRKRFTIGINDDVSKLSLDYDPHFSTEKDDVVRAMFYGLGSDGTVGANKDTTKIIGENTPLNAQGYFVYDSKKSGSITVSHLRFSPRPIKGSYLVTKANFIACHQFVFTEKLDMLANIIPGGTFLLNCPYGPNEVWQHIPVEMQQEIIDKKLKFYVIDAIKVAHDTGMGGRINTIMQTCFFKLAGFLPEDEAIDHIKKAIKKTYGSKGDAVVAKNHAAVDASLAALYEVKVPAAADSKQKRQMGMSGKNIPKFVNDVLGEILANRGDNLPVSAFAPDGTFPTATSQYERRSIAIDIPIWNPDCCIQCAQCSLVCPHAAIRIKQFAPETAASAPAAFRSADWKTKEFPGAKMCVQVAPDDCVGCGLCVVNCPGKNKAVEGKKAINMETKLDHLDAERANWDYFLSIADTDRALVNPETIKGSQLMLPLMEFSGACSACGETPYIKLVTQFFGDRMLIANATGCSSIYGGNLPTTPYCVDGNGRGPAWCNSLFEDNAEFGLGLRLAIDKQRDYAEVLMKSLSGKIGDNLIAQIVANKQETEVEIAEQRKMIAELKAKLAGDGSTDARELISVADNLVRRSCWIVGGDGWAYDIGYGGLDHVLASGKDVNILVLDTEVYSNTGGQASKATPLGAVAKFAAGGKPTGKKDLGLMAVSYGNVFVGQIALGANPMHTIRTIRAAESYRGPSLLIAYSHCIAQGINMENGLELQKEAVACGYWPLYHYDPREAKPFSLDSKEPKGELKDFAAKQNRFAVLNRANPQVAAEFNAEAQKQILERFKYYTALTEAKTQE